MDLLVIRFTHPELQYILAGLYVTKPLIPDLPCRHVLLRESQLQLNLPLRECQYNSDADIEGQET